MKRLIKFSAVVFAAIVCAADGMARQLTPAEALAGARASAGSMRHGMPSLAGSEMKLAYTGARDGINCYYVFDSHASERGGFVIVSADDLAPALLGRVDEGEFDYDSAPAAMKWWLSLYETNITDAVRTGTPIRRQTAEERPLIGHLMTTKWDQGDPFNMYCPSVSGSRCVSGCAATAMAQVMRHHRWPEVGTGSHSYTTETHGISLSADFGSTTYDWDNMLDRYTLLSPRVSKEAAGTLVYHCGVAIDMDYSPAGSGATSTSVARALVQYFGYDKGLHYEDRIYYTDSQWEDLIYGELAEGRPVYYSGATVKNEGHAFVCDGYSGDGLYHFNWGWGGSYDGDFLITGANALNPDGSGTGGGTVGYGFTEYQSCLFGVQKERGDSKTYIVMASPYGISLSSNGATVTRDSWLEFYGNIYSYSTTTVNVEFGVMFRNTSTGEVRYSSSTVRQLQPLYGISGLLFTPDGVTDNGEYEVTPVYRAARSHDEWQPVRIKAGTPVPRITVTGSRPTLMLADDIYVGDNGDNTVTADNVKVRFTLSASYREQNRKIVATVRDYDEGNTVGTISTTISMTAGETREFVMTGDMTGLLTVGKKYALRLRNESTGEPLTPSFYAEAIFTVVEPSGISEAVVSDGVLGSDRVDVYSLAGTLLRSGVKAGEALETLPAGMYIVGGKKVVKK